MKLAAALAATIVALQMARPAQAQPAAASLACDQAALVAERAHGLPPGLLAAIGRVESGRVDPLSGRVRPWPWALNAEGMGLWPAAPEAAIAAVESLRARGTSSIDIGCFQVNLLHHPDAFPTLAAGFDPFVNADYAARFLVSLQRRTGDWAQAVAAYHSSTAGLGEPYWAKVKAAWAMSGAVPLPATPDVPASGPKVWTPAEPGAAPQVIRIGGDDAAYPQVVYLTAAAASQN